MGELTALFQALASSSSVTTRLHIEIFRTNEHATGVVGGRTRAQHATGLVHQAKDVLQQARRPHEVPTHHVEVAGNEDADVLANTGRIRGPAVFSGPRFDRHRQLTQPASRQLLW